MNLESKNQHPQPDHLSSSEPESQQFRLPENVTAFIDDINDLTPITDNKFEIIQDRERLRRLSDMTVTLDIQNMLINNLESSIGINNEDGQLYFTPDANIIPYNLKGQTINSNRVQAWLSEAENEHRITGNDTIDWTGLQQFYKEIQNQTWEKFTGKPRGNKVLYRKLA